MFLKSTRSIYLLFLCFKMTEFKMAEFRIAEFRMAIFRLTEFKMAEFLRVQPFSLIKK